MMMMVMMKKEGGEGGGEERRGGEELTLKSSNPNLTGGEKKHVVSLCKLARCKNHVFFR